MLRVFREGNKEGKIQESKNSKIQKSKNPKDVKKFNPIIELFKN